jgi:hypothetical protein
VVHFDLTGLVRGYLGWADRLEEERARWKDDPEERRRAEFVAAHLEYIAAWLEGTKPGIMGA